MAERARKAIASKELCETPKSPPGDYNLTRVGVLEPFSDAVRVKHLNPRQGITILPNATTMSNDTFDVCETPKSPPGDYNQAGLPRPQRGPICVKHLNPRQGITTLPGRDPGPPGQREPGV